ncbi:hypothetical protein LCGC14_0225460 [marine sediment metagenome]|uniref:Uncharacterized protein n=1 Tax=marine sediment metagenome TaxID=412755 RepID=A0A0F9UU12_9ZZZZ
MINKKELLEYLENIINNIKGNVSFNVSEYENKIEITIIDE